MAVPKQFVGMRMLRPGFYMDSKGSFHLDEHGLCQSLGIAYTEQTAAILRRVMAEVFRKEYGYEPSMEVRELTRPE